ncbi:MAG: VOC family protein [Myxococcota bacterium]|nr:VOC family protein [Myxococcota bacterium]
MAVAQLGYLGFGVSDLAAWESFTTEVLGLELCHRQEDGGFRLRMDGHTYRLLITPDQADDLVVVGWETASPEELSACVERLKQAGVTIREGTPEERSARGVEALFQFEDPAGIPTEIYFGPTLAESAFQSPVLLGSFIADQQGLGHAVLTANSQQESLEFYSNLLGFRLSDYIRCEIHGYPVDIAFLHANSRHHSVAFGAQQPKRLHHFMLEVSSVDDVGLCYDRCIRHGVRIMQTLGRHPNDRMFSFYARTPSGFQFEFGCGGRQVDDATWEVTTHDRISEWGHHPPHLVSPRKK